jgi:YVTN family beta-propeller protein
MNHLRKACGITLVAVVLMTSSAGAAPFAYFPTIGERVASITDTVSIVDTATDTLVTTVPVGYGPWGVAVAPDGTNVYVTNGDSGTVSVIDTCTKAVVKTIPVPGYSIPTGIAVAPDGSKAYVTNGGSNTLSVIDTAAYTVNSTVTVGTDPFGVAVAPDGTKVYVTNRGSNTVSVIDTASNTLIKTVAVGFNPWGVAVTPDGKRAYVANRADSTVSLIDTGTYAVTTLWYNRYNLMMMNPVGVAVNQDGTKVYVTNEGSNTVSMIDTASNTITATVNVEDSPSGVAVTPDGTKVYVGNRAPGEIPVSIINTATNAVTAITVGNAPIAFGQFIGVQPSCAPTRPIASFTATPDSGPEDLKVQFTDTSTNNPTSWDWDFGDYTYGFVQYFPCNSPLWRWALNWPPRSVKNPSYIYTKRGTYPVKLTVHNAGGPAFTQRTVTVGRCRNDCTRFPWVPCWWILSH